MQCKRCKETNPKYFYQDEGVWYCRKCIKFGRINIGEDIKQVALVTKEIDTTYSLPYDLTDEQKEIKDKLRETLKNKQKILIYAACGAGKTEITMESIERYLRMGKKVGYAISRRQVVLEIAVRMQEAFSNIKVVQVCAGYTNETDGDLIICTTHQLYRYHQSFDLLVMDEIDAFPYANDPVLQRLAQHACRGEMILLTATPNEELKAAVRSGEVIQYTLFKRPHGYPLIVPKLKRCPHSIQYVLLFYLLCRRRKQKWIVFVPTIHDAQIIYRFYRFFLSCEQLTSKSEDNEQKMIDFNKGKYQLLVATTILERGITVKGVHVIVLKGEHKIYQEANLIQMIGRVGRKKEAPTGEAYIFGKKKTKVMTDCVRTIAWMNTHE